MPSSHLKLGKAEFSSHRKYIYINIKGLWMIASALIIIMAKTQQLKPANSVNATGKLAPHLTAGHKYAYLPPRAMTTLNPARLKAQCWTLGKIQRKSSI